MADWIDRDAVLSEIGEFQARFNETGDSHERVAYASAEHCMLVIKAAPAVNRWIPCSERLPEPLQTVIVCTDINTVTVAWLNGDHWTFADTGGGHTEDWSFDAVKYWMNFPEPPESEVQE